MTVQAYQADLHIHTLLSPCAEVEMIPSLIVAAAQLAGLDIIAVTDHNSCENAGAVIGAAEGTGLKVLPGMEVQSVEGVHLLCLFESIEQAEQMQAAVYERLPDVALTSRLIQEQMIVDSRDEFVRYCEKPLSLPTSLDIEEVYAEAVGLGGMVFPSHIDRPETGICGVLGMLPETPDFPAVEISANITAADARRKYPSVGGRAIVMASDAHWLSAIGEQRTVLYLEHRSVDEIRMACLGEGGRRVGDA